ncbi:hypothetical protein CYY_001106 [Polysphondylium violaceum]|uniref:DNA primase n=1 Tax=Polysphondylium violaceum TaxID=133409 RepID=A0A8J4V1V8_9MYCE|nr:hypothetical protein CYY_001106 [Polysphondylium violaceum]
MDTQTKTNDNDINDEDMDDIFGDTEGSYELDNKVSLRVYYDQYFPFDLIYEWLSINSLFGHGEASQIRFFERREFSSRITKMDGTTFVTRNRSFSKLDDIKDYLKGRNPNNNSIDVAERLDIGPIYSCEPIKKSMVTDYTPLYKEIVFDIDINDYNDIRVCCSDTSLCMKCWGFLAVAAKFVEMYMKECFGFEQLLYVFSGRRGLHVWVSDQRALSLSSEARANIIKYVKYERTSVLLPILQRGFDELFLPYFEQHVLEEQDIFGNAAQYKNFLSKLPLEVRVGKKTIIHPLDQIKEKMLEIKDQATSLEKWRAISDYFKQNNLMEYVYDIVFHYTLPRFDDKVTNHIIHLLKSPFCIHPSTGKLCVPIDLKDIDQFNPTKVPLLNSILSTPKVSFNPYRASFKNYIEQMKLKSQQQISINDPTSF